MKHILALDQGTTSSRAIVFDSAGGIRSVAQQEFRQIFPKPGWVEHDPEEIWSSQLAVAREALEYAAIGAGDVAAIGITNQRETALVWDRRTGIPIYNAIVWQDRRTSGVCDALRAEGYEDLVRNRTGLVIDAYFSGTKVQWILDNVEGARQKAASGELCFGTVDSWLIWKLTGGRVHVTDATNASRTMLYNIRDHKWDDELLSTLDIPPSVLPEVRSSSEVYADSDRDHFGLPIPIAGIAGDQQAALFGQVCTRPGMVKNTYGTGCFMLMNTGEDLVYSKNNLVSTIAWSIDGRVEYALEGSIFIAGAVVQWLRDGLGLIKRSSDVEALAAQVDESDGVYFVPAFTGLGAPHWDQYARGTIVGLTRGTNAAHLARASLESIAFQTVDVIRAMEADSGIEVTELRVDGGATANDLLMQFQSDVLGVSVVRPAVRETTSLGAAYLAGLAVGYWEDLESISRQWTVERRFTPAMDESEAAHLLGGWIRAIERSKRWEEEG